MLVEFYWRDIPRDAAIPADGVKATQVTLEIVPRVGEQIDLDLPILYPGGYEERLTRTGWVTEVCYVIRQGIRLARVTVGDGLDA